MIYQAQPDQQKKPKTPITQTKTKQKTGKENRNVVQNQHQQLDESDDVNLMDSSSLTLSTDHPNNGVAHQPPVSWLGPQRKNDQGKKTLILDLDETLVHSSF